MIGRIRLRKIAVGTCYSRAACFSLSRLVSWVGPGQQRSGFILDMDGVGVCRDKKIEYVLLKGVHPRRSQGNII